MSSPMPQIAELKNQWMRQHIDVEFPTPESLLGYELYQQRSSNADYQPLQRSDSIQRFPDEEIYKVDFHRLTVMFALLQASMWPEPRQQQLMVEFLSQIIYSEPCELYLGFQGGEAVLAAIVTKDQDQALISDIAAKIEAKDLQPGFIASLADRLHDNEIIWLEHI